MLYSICVYMVYKLYDPICLNGVFFWLFTTQSIRGMRPQGWAYSIWNTRKNNCSVPLENLTSKGVMYHFHGPDLTEGDPRYFPLLSYTECMYGIVLVCGLEASKSIKQY